MMKEDDTGANGIKNYYGRVGFEKQGRKYLSNLTQTNLTLLVFIILEKST